MVGQLWRGGGGGRGRGRQSYVFADQHGTQDVNSRRGDIFRGSTMFFFLFFLWGGGVSSPLLGNDPTPCMLGGEGSTRERPCPMCLVLLEGQHFWRALVFNATAFNQSFWVLIAHRC